jgi:hypothetical protein
LALSAHPLYLVFARDVAFGVAVRAVVVVVDVHPLLLWQVTQGSIDLIVEIYLVLAKVIIVKILFHVCIACTSSFSLLLSRQLCNSSAVTPLKTIL